jgi:hypothetical protein
VSEFAARFRIQLDGGQDFLSWVDKANTGVKQLEKNHTSAMTAMGRAAKTTAEDMGRLGLAAGKTALSVAGLNLGLAAQAKGILEFRDNVTKLATAASMAEGGIGGLRDQIQSVAVASGQMREGVTEALQAFVAKTGNIETARKNLELYAKTATGTGAALSEVALIGAELTKKFGVQDQRTALAVLAKQGDIGAIEFKDLASQGPRIFASAASAGMTGEAGIRKIGGLAQLFADGVGGSGSAARVATSIEGLMRDVSRKKGQGLLKKMGIEVGDRDAVEITEDVIRKFHGDDRAIQKTGLYTAAAMRGVMTMTRAYRNSGGKGFGQLDEFTNVEANDQIIADKFARNAKTGQFGLNSARERIKQAYEKNLGDKVEWLARNGSSAVATGMEFATSHPGLVGGAVVGGMFARNLMRGGGGGSGVGNLLGMGGQRVFVTNWPGGAGGGLGGLGAAAEGVTKKLGTLQMATQNFGLLLGALGAGAAAGTYLDNKFGLSDLGMKSMRMGLGDDKREQEAIARGSAAHRGMLAGKSRAREILVAQFEAQGMSHGQALYRADHQSELKQTVNITVNGHDVDVQSDGTRKPEVKLKRGASR